MPNLPKVARVTSYAKEYTKTLEAEFQNRTRRAAEVIRQRLRSNLSKPGNGSASKPGEYPRSQSGKLVAGVRTVLAKRNPYSFRVINRMWYNDALEFGTQGGRVIVPKRAKALRFNVKAGRKVSTVFTKRVIQGAIKARSQARRTLDEMRPQIKAIYVRGISELLKGNRATVRIG